MPNPEEERRLRERWEKLYGEQENLRRIFSEPYTRALAPFLAGAIDYHARLQGKLRILVVGGGKGRFSRELLPKVRELLEKKGRKVELDVVETDLASVIRQAPAAKRAQAEVKRLPFKSETFDLVVGEAMIHQGGPAGVPRSISEIKRVLAKDGSFIHVADITPDPREWTGPGVAAAVGFGKETPALRAGGGGHGRQLMDMSAQAHANLAKLLHLTARAHGLSFAALTAQEEALVPAGPRSERLHGIKVGRFNTLRFSHGGIQTANEPGVPPGQRKIGYEGVVTVATKLARVSDLVAHIQKSGYYRE
jgi:SAM-dependent methyltransferase